VLLVAMGAVLALPSRPGPAYAATITVNIGNDFYTNSPSTTNNCGGPCVTNIAVGDTVHWVWLNSSPNHSTTSDVSSSQVWDSGEHANPHSFDRMFTTPGSFSYHCTVHPITMFGTIVVTAPSVGGVARLPDAAHGSAAAARGSSSSSVGLIAGSAAIAAGLIALGGAAWYARRRRVS
jgi:plastocyanin